MKIEKIECFPVLYELPRPFSNSAETHTKRSTTLVKITTDTNIVGWGEAYGPAKGVVGIIDGYLKEKFLGQNPLNVEYLWFKTMSHKGISPGALAGIDIALWDIKAKFLNIPLYELLGGLSSPKLFPYATGFFFGEKNPDSLEVFEKEIETILSQGFKAVKVKIGFGLSRDLKRLNRLRELIGPDIDIMVDANQAYDFRTCLSLIPELEDLKIRWLEEPMAWHSFDSYKKLREKTIIPIAGGEAEYSYSGFVNAISKECVDIIQPDILACGGLTIARRIVLIAEAFGVEFQPHIFGGVLSLALAIQLVASLSANQQWMTFPRPIMIEWDSTENPFSKELLKTPLQLEKDGIHLVSNKPGIGIDINEDAIEKYIIK